MDLDPTREQQQLVSSFVSLYSRESPPERVREAEPLGFHEALWERLVETGVVAMAVDESHGGGGASLLDLALVAEQHGRFIAPAPVIEAQVAARLLMRLDGDAAQRALAAALTGNGLVTVSLRPSVHGVATLVPAGAVADQAVVLHGDRLLLVPLDNQRHVPNLGMQPLADVTVTDDAVELARGEQARDAFARAVREWMVLAAASLVGMTARSLEIGVAYVKERHAFGVPIGSFQAVAHRLADRATEADGAQLLAREAAWADQEDPGRAMQLAAMALAFCSEAARDATYDALHFHGGYGFMEEYDIQLYFRRARGLGGLLAEPRELYRMVADNRSAAETTAQGVI